MDNRLSVYIASILLFLFGGVCLYADEIFYVPNENGCMIAYMKLTDNTVRIIAEPGKAIWKGDNQGDNYAQCKCDTLSLPSIISHNGKDYTVTEIDYDAFYHVSTIKKVIIPASVNTLCGIGFPPFFSYHANPFMFSSIEEIEIDDKNPNYVSYKGLVFSKNMRVFHSCPPCYKKDTLTLPEGLQHLGPFSLSNLTHVKTIVLPLTLKYVHNVAFYDSESVQHIVFQDSVKSITQNNFAHFPNLSDVTFGAMLDTIMLNELFWQPMTMHIRTKNVPYSGFSIPESYKNDVPNQKENMDASVLYVPRSSITLYNQAPGWRLFGKILPIEPPIVSGVNEAEVSWVQNFSATGYVWTLYLDEAQTQPYLQLTFDKDGHLTNIDLNRPNAPQLPAEEGDKQEDKRYAEYYSFTITGLDANTKYYYTRQSLAGEKVIDEETGSFETLPDGAPTGINPLLFEPSPQKTFENGRLIINHNGNKYNVSGAKAE